MQEQIVSNIQFAYIGLDLLVNKEKKDNKKRVSAFTVKRIYTNIASN